MKCIIGDNNCKYIIITLLVFSNVSYDPLTRMTPKSSTLIKMDISIVAAAFPQYPI
jgi:hypothetical protein